MIVPVNHFSDAEVLPDGKMRHRVLAYPAYYRDDVSGNLLPSDPTWQSSDHPAISDWMMKRGVYSVYAANDGRWAVKHLGAAITFRLARLAFVRADRTFRLVPTLPTFGTPAVSGGDLTWADVWPGVSLTLTVIEDQLREVFTITPAAQSAFRTWAQGQGENLSTGFIAILFELDWFNLDGISPFDQDIELDDLGPYQQDGEAETFRRILFKKAGHIKALFPEGWFRSAVWSDMEDDPANAYQTRKLRRFLRYNGRNWYAVGARLADFAGWPVGDIVANDTITFRQGVSPDAGYTGCKSAGMTGANTDKTYAHLNYAGPAANAPGYRGFIAFDVSDLAATATVNDASVYLTCIGEYNTTDRTVSLWKMLKDWHQPVADSEPPNDANDDPCWSHQYWDETTWGTAGAAGEDVDRDTDVGASVSITSAAPTEFKWTSASIIALVQGWVAGTTANYGVQIVGDDAGTNRWKLFAAENNATTSYRPKLVVDYTLAGGSPYTLSVDVGAFALTGPPAAVRADRIIAPSVGAFGLTGNAAGLVAARALYPAVGEFSLTGNAAGLVYSGAGGYGVPLSLILGGA